MLRFLADEDFNNHIIRGLLRQQPDLDIIRVQDRLLTGIDDPIVLEQAALENRILLTHDVSTMTKYAYERVEQGLLMPGVFEVSQLAAMGLILEDILLLALYSVPDEWRNRIIYIPLK